MHQYDRAAYRTIRLSKETDMFQIGEFSKIAQTSVTQLHYYDEIGLFKPARVDRSSGYRYYSAEQLPQLNRIIALKELGLPLEQIQRMIHDPISADEIRRMLASRKSQIEAALKDDIARLHQVEGRLRQIEQEGELRNDDIVIKSLPSRPYLSTRKVLANFMDIRLFAGGMRSSLPGRVGAKNLGNFTVVLHGDAFLTEQPDIELGYLLNAAVDSPIQMPNGAQIETTVLPSVEMAATAVRIGPFENGFGPYAALGRWVEDNNYVLAGPVREEFLVLPTRSPDEAVVEIQIPVAPAENDSATLFVE
jgi:DNA-binding transcriptional MerR regulator